MSVRRLWRDLLSNVSTFGRGIGRAAFLTGYVRKARLNSVAQFPEGSYGRIVGRALPIGQPLFAPVSGLPCVFYILRVVDPYVRARRTGDPVPVARETSSAPFWVEDSTGRALIDPVGATGFLGEPVVNATCARVPQAIMWLMHANQRQVHPRFTYAEWIVPVGARVSVLGGGTREPDPDALPSPEYRGEPPMRLRIARTEPYSLMISDASDTFR